ncbi:MAG: tetratricopeptide repeat protein, partial [Polyangiales bacterium]
AVGLFALALCWTCLHAGTSLLLIGVALAVAGGAWLNTLLRLGPCAGAERRDEPLRALLLAALPLATFLLVPGALSSVVHFSGVLGSIVAAREPEWRPSLGMLDYGQHPVAILTAFAPYIVGTAYALTRVRAVRRLGRAALDLAEVLPCVACLVLAALVTRNLFLCLLPLAAIALRLRPSLTQGRALYIGAFLLFAISADWAGRDAYGGFARARVAFAQDLAPGAYPEHTAAFMRRAGIAGKILNLPRWGDYLVYTQYPRCRVFFDSRRDVTQPMWELLERAAHPDLRSDVLDAAFARYGTELVVYEGPVFAGFRPTGEWRLLYRAGPEELYQHARGPHAAQNLAAARRDLAARGGRVSDDDASVAYVSTVTALGAREWRSTAWERELEREQRDALGSADPAVAHAAERALGLLAFRAGDYAEAAQRLSAVLGQDASDASARYHLAFALALSDEPEHAAQMARSFTQQGALALSPAQRYRLGVLLRELSAGK